MKFRTTFILLAIAIALGSFILVLDHQSSTTRERSERTQRIFTVQRNEIRGFTIHNGDDEVKVRADGDTWKLVKPWKDDADGGLVDQLLNAIQMLRPDDIIDNLGKGDSKRDKIKEFGLHRSRISLKLDGRHTPAEIQFGGDAAVPGKSYLKVGDEDQVYVVSDDLRNIASKKPEDFRDHRITPFLTTLISRVVIRMNGGEIDLEKQQDNWQLTRPIKARANNDAVTNLLTKINQTQIAKFVSGGKNNAPATGLDSPSAVITLYVGNDDSAEIQLGAVDPAENQKNFAYLPRRDAFVEINKPFAELLDITPNDLRDRKLARINSDLVDRVTIEKAGQPRLVLGRDEDRWKFVAPESAPANSNSLDRLFQKVNSGEINAFISNTATDLGRYGFDKPTLRLTFSSYASENTAESNAGEAVLATIEFGKSENGSTYGRIADEPFVFSVPDTLVAGLPTDKFDFKTLTITDLKRPDLISVHIERFDSEPLDLVRNDQNKWTLKGEESLQNDGQIQLLLNTVCSIRAADWVGDPKPEYGLESPSMTLVVTYQNAEKKEVVTLRIGSADPEHFRFCSVSSSGGVFRINETTFDQLGLRLARNP
jgi:hypothetical protein